jgi:outer membrane protein OmpA-like peptidoglycan-associated protein
MPLTVPFQDMPIGNRPVEPLPDQTLDPADIPLAPPRILSVKSIAEGDESSVDEDADNRAVRLSSDVLFALDKADLTARAAGILEKVGKQIDASKGVTVKVDGYADNTGNDAINQPLSERRAEAVKMRLRTLVTRQGITYQSAGHGSKDPVAPNDVEEGRRKNRRVTVTFTPPSPAPPLSSPTATGTPFRRSERDASVLGSGRFPVAEAKDVKAEINNIHRDAGGLTILAWTVRNTGSVQVTVTTVFEALTRPIRGFGVGGVMLIDPVARMRYQPLVADNGQCLCTQLVFGAKTVLGPGDSTTYSNVYKLPPETANVDIEIPWNVNTPGNHPATVKGIAVK